jgi:hypothetical protein
VAALSAFLTYVGAGLDGQAGLGDYNLQLNDDYRGEFVRGCPAYDEVRRPSMDGFDLEEYQGKWYEQKFHDWTQFKEVYDTTLDIKLTSDKKVNYVRVTIDDLFCSDVRTLSTFVPARRFRDGSTTSESRDRRRTPPNCPGINRPSPTGPITS